MTSGNDSDRMQEAVRRRAVELFQHGSLPAPDTDNWRQAEAEILREPSTHPTRRSVVVNIDGVVYTGEYESSSAEGYTPGEWKPGNPVPVRLSGNRLYLRRTNGGELKTTIVKRIG